MLKIQLFVCQFYLVQVFKISGFFSKYHYEAEDYLKKEAEIKLQKKCECYLHMRAIKEASGCSIICSNETMYVGTHHVGHAYAIPNLILPHW